MVILKNVKIDLFSKLNEFLKNLSLYVILLIRKNSLCQTRNQLKQ